MLLQDQRRDIHAAGRRTGTEHDSESHAEQQAGEDRIQEQILCEPGFGERKRFEHAQCQRVNERGHQRGERECFPQKDQSQNQQDRVHQQDRGGHRQPGEFLQRQGNAGRAAGDQSSRDQKQPDGQGIDNISGDDLKNVQDHAPGDRDFFMLFHERTSCMQYAASAALFYVN